MMRRRHLSLLSIVIVSVFAFVGPAGAQETQPTPRQVLLDAMSRWVNLFEGQSQIGRTLVGHFKVTRSQGLPAEADGLVADLAFQAPDRVRLNVVTAKFPV